MKLSNHKTNSNIHSHLHLFNQISQLTTFLIINKLSKIIILAIYHQKVW